MPRTIFIGILVMVAVIGSASAQTECGGSCPPGDCQPCTFQCHQGDYITVNGSSVNVFNYPDTCLCLNPAEYGPARVAVRASCGGVIVECNNYSQFDCFGQCQAVSEDTVASNDKNGTCEVLLDQGTCGSFSCRSVTPEGAAELEGTGQGIVIKIPEK